VLQGYRDWRSPFPFPTGSSRQVNCDPAWRFWVPEGAKGRDLNSPFLLLSGVLHLVSASSFAFFHRVAAFSLETRLD